jgi:hypothetical protein
VKSSNSQLPTTNFWIILNWWLGLMALTLSLWILIVVPIALIAVAAGVALGYLAATLLRKSA